MAAALPLPSRDPRFRGGAGRTPKRMVTAWPQRAQQRYIGPQCVRDDKPCPAHDIARDAKQKLVNLLAYAAKLFGAEL